MAQTTIINNSKLAGKIKQRRIELHLTIEEAAKRANVGTKTWSRYESGGAIREDKYKGVCKCLNWLKFPEEEDYDLKNHKNHEVWSKYLEENYGEIAAISFSIGSDILLDHIKEDLYELSKLPKGTHIGQLGTSFIESLLPEQFMMEYNYEFVYCMYCELLKLRGIAQSGNEIIVHSVLEELILHMIAEESVPLIESTPGLDDDCTSWIYEIFDDDDIDIFLYSNINISDDNDYHFSHWLKEQFYC